MPQEESRRQARLSEESKRAKVTARRISREIEATKNDETQHPQMYITGEGDLWRFHAHDWDYYHQDSACTEPPVLECKDDTMTSYCSGCGLVVASTLSTVGANRTRIGRKNAWS